MKKAFPERLRDWRGIRFQRDAALFLQMPISTYRKYENGKRTPNKYALAELERRMAKYTPPE